MISPLFADAVLIVSMIVSLAAYVQVSKRDGSYINILTPTFVMGIPANYFFPLFYTHVIGNDAGSYAYTYVYTTIAVETAVFAYFYARRSSKTIVRSPFSYSYGNFFSLALVFLGLAVLMYAPILLEFHESLLDPRQIYRETRTGFGVNFYISTAFCYLAFICAIFSARSWLAKGSVALAATLLISLHGSKGLALNVVFLLALFGVYVARRKVGWWPSLLASLGMGFLALALFAATMVLGDSPLEVLETISGYSDYTRNAMMVIDSKIPVQYGRLTMEASVIGRIPRVLMPGKPKNFGYMYLDEIFYPQSLDQDAGVPEFGIGVQYADFGFLAIVYLAAFAALRGWLARMFVDRLKKTRHPADFFLLAFFANISLLSVGGVGWLLPEALVVAAFLYFASRLGAKKVYRERLVAKPRFASQSRKAIHGTQEG